MLTRKPVCAGTWYPAGRKEIASYIDAAIKPENRIKASACVCPHAGWMYSGRVAGSVYSSIDLNAYDTFILVGPNHTGRGAGVGVYAEGEWQMPLGNVPVNEELAKSIIQFSEFLEQDERCHANEHSIEVQIPFIQYFNSNAKIVPIALMRDDFEICLDVANAVSSAIKHLKIQDRVLLIASSDMTHYEPQTLAEEKDKIAIENILEMDARGLVRTVTGKGITMCGVYPVASVILAAGRLGAKSAELVTYATSGDVTGDYTSVVGYAGLIIK